MNHLQKRTPASAPTTPSKAVQAVQVVAASSPHSSSSGSRWTVVLILAAWLVFACLYFQGWSSNSSSGASSRTTEMQVVTTTSDGDDSYCDAYEGVLWIQQGDHAGACGTIFFLFLVNQLLYAEKYNLQPFIHLNTVSRHVYDEQVHGASSSPKSLVMGKQGRLTFDLYKDPLQPNITYRYPGPPVWDQDIDNRMASAITMEGSGVWNSYFETRVPLPQAIRARLPKSVQQQQFLDLSRPCPHKPWVTMTDDAHLVYGLHLNCPYCVRAWKYGGMPPTLKNITTTSYHTWWQPMRQKGHDMLRRYYRPLPYLQQLARQVLPNHNNDNNKCLAMHIRHSDKDNQRRKIRIASFLPYCQAFVQQGGTTIYIATDSSRVLERIQAEWPPEIVRALRWQTDIVRSANTTAVFRSGHSHHRTNTEVLVDILAMSNCHWMLHGLSAVSEATMYWNPGLHNRSVNLEFDQYYQRMRQRRQRRPQTSGGLDHGEDDYLDAPMSVEDFAEMLRQTGLSKG